MRIAIAHGLHRRSKNHATNPRTQDLSTYMLQNNVRIWWTTYILERSIEFLMGRPSQIRDEDIDRESPLEQHGFPRCDGLRAHVDLAMIKGQIVSQVFRARRRKKEDVEDTILSLKAWKDGLPPSLRLRQNDYTSSSRTVLLLHLECNQVLPQSM
jgi:Fungal specific transcription factor domain